MKKALLALLTAGLISGGTLGAPTANADEYPGTVPTVTNADGAQKVVAGKRPRSTVRVKAAGNGKPVGSIRVRYFHKASQTSRYQTVRYRGERLTFRGPALKRTGAWRLYFVFRPKAGSVWKSSRDSYRLRVVKKR